jgi:hypothetical protein
MLFLYGRRKETTVRKLPGRQPIIKSSLDPRWHRYSSNVTSFSYQIDDGPVILATLEMLYSQLRELPPSQPTT